MPGPKPAARPTTHEPPLLPPSASRKLAAAPARRQRLSAEQKQFLESRPSVAQVGDLLGNKCLFACVVQELKAIS